MKLDIITPQQIYFSGEVNLVTLPGTNGEFTLLNNHAPIISSLTSGRVVYETGSSVQEVSIQGGFMEMSSNVVTVSVDSLGNG